MIVAERRASGQLNRLPRICPCCPAEGEAADWQRRTGGLAKGNARLGCRLVRTRGCRKSRIECLKFLRCERE